MGRSALVVYLFFLALLLLAPAVQANSQQVTIAYQTSPEPAKVAQYNGDFARQSGADVQWRKFDSGSAVLRALASGDVQIGNMGSSPLAVAASQKLPVKIFLIASQLGQSEALIVNQKITEPSQLIGKRIAVPFISTAHYSLLAALHHWQIDPKLIQIINLQPPAIVAAWKRGDIDGAFVWLPAVNELAATGRVLTDAAQIAQWGAPTLDVWVVRNDFAEQHPELVTIFVKSVLDENQCYLTSPETWLANNKNIAAVSRLSGLSEDKISQWILTNRYLNADQQLSLLKSEMAKVIRDTARFLQQQGKVSQVADNYQDYVTDKFIKAIIPSKMAGGNDATN